MKFYYFFALGNNDPRDYRRHFVFFSCVQKVGDIFQFVRAPVMKRRILRAVGSYALG